MTHAELLRNPELELDTLLGFLGNTDDGFDCERTVQPDERMNGRIVEMPVWELGTSDATVDVAPWHECGFHENADTPLLGVLTQRLSSTKGRLTLSLVPRLTNPDEATEKHWIEMEWQASAMIGETPWSGYDTNRLREGSQGFGQNRCPGVAVLLAYLRAWGTLG